MMEKCDKIMGMNWKRDEITNKIEYGGNVAKTWVNIKKEGQLTIKFIKKSTEKNSRNHFLEKQKSFPRQN